MIIKSHRLTGARYMQAVVMGGEIEPRLIVIHETAGRLEPLNTVKWLQSRDCKVSYHFVIERDGAVIQMVPCNRKAYHAGVSEWQGRKFANSFSISIGLVGPGKLDDQGRAWFGEAIQGAEAASTPEHGAGKWLPFTPAQMEACRNLCVAIMAAYVACNDVAGHWEISPGRKVDPNPLFPMDAFRASLMAPEVEEEIPEPPAPVSKPVAVATAGGGGAVVWFQPWTWPWNEWLLSLGCNTGIECASALGSYASKPMAMVSMVMIVGAVWMARRAKA